MAVKNKVTVNADQKLFVIPTGGGYSCLGFEVCRERTERYQAWLSANNGPTFSDAPEVGTLQAYERYLAVIGEIMKSKTRCDADLSPQLIGLEGRRVEVEDNFGDVRRFNVGKSMGPIHIHLEIHNSRSSGGGAADRSYKRVTVIH